MSDEIDKSWPGARRAFDVPFAVVALFLLCPVMIGIAVSVRLKIGSPVLFTPTRVGQYFEPFKMSKFLTMRNTRGPDGQFLPDSERRTPLGNKFRSSRLDELPNLYDILKRKMQLIGPRPAPANELTLAYFKPDNVEEEEWLTGEVYAEKRKWILEAIKERQSILPGIIALGHIKNHKKRRNAELPPIERLEEELKYVQARKAGGCWRLDIKILFMAAAMMATTLVKGGGDLSRSTDRRFVDDSIQALRRPPGVRPRYRERPFGANRLPSQTDTQPGAGCGLH